MRIATHVIAACLSMLVVGCLWQFLPVGRSAPEVAALFAVYLGVTARDRLASPVLGAVIIGYLADLLSGTPIGMSSVVCGIVALIGHVVYRRILVRGVGMKPKHWTLVLSGVTTVAALALLAGRLTEAG